MIKMNNLDDFKHFFEKNEINITLFTTEDI